MNIFLHQKNNEIGNLDKSTSVLIETFNQQDTVGLHLYPELYLGGYPLQDVCLQMPFIKQYQKCLKVLRETANKSASQSILFGGLDYKISPDNEIIHIYNCIYLLDKAGLRVVYRKQLLPNYDIYDEKKYFTPGIRNCFLEINNHRFCLFICEDMWHSSAHKIDPVSKAFDEFLRTKEEVHAIINLSASPFHIGKQKTRVNRAKEISSSFKAPFIYVNQIGLNDEVLFDGQSFVCFENVVNQCESFSEDILSYTLCKNEQLQPLDYCSSPSRIENTWENLFKARINKEDKCFKRLSNNELKDIISAQTFALNEYAQKTKMKSFLIALSGGIDSAVTLALAHLAAKASGLQVEAIYMPSRFNSNLSYELSKEMCENIGIKLKVINLKFIHQTIKMTFNDEIGEELLGLADENIQSRLRGSLIYTRSNQTGAMVLNTSNKSEISVGYSTLYGDSVGAISILGDLYKTEVYQVAQFINECFDHIIPEGIITRAPSAELREDQKDEDSLPAYDRLDLILECLLSYRYTLEQILDLGISKKELEHVYGLYNRAEFKRFQFCPIVKLKSKSFGFGYRNPILKNLNFC
jgi:NAD+ synthase (glutamine-hydrolysing)